jgi:hypothetical protein
LHEVVGSAHGIGEENDAAGGDEALALLRSSVLRVRHNDAPLGIGAAGGGEEHGEGVTWMQGMGDAESNVTIMQRGKMMYMLAARRSAERNVTML